MSSVAIHGVLLAALWGAETDATPPVTNSLGMILVLIPPGEFLMGNHEDPKTTLARFPYALPDWVADETPRHRVRITRAFYLGAHEVTLGQFLTFYHAAHYKLESERRGRLNWGYDSKQNLVRSRSYTPWSPGWQVTFKHPVVQVSWNDAVAFCQWLSEQEGRKYRLPTEAEWEYACRAGSTALYSNGDNPRQLVSVANLADAALGDTRPRAHLVLVNDKDTKKNMQVPYPFLSARDGFVYTAPVGSFLPNAFGLYDMHGNVWEWCSDRYSRDYYSTAPTDDPPGPASGTMRIIRGGGWFSPASDLRSSQRGNAPPEHSFYMWGFRVVCETPFTHLETAGISLRL